MFPTVFRLFPTVSDRFIFSEGLIGPIPFMEGWSSAKPVRTMTLKFFGATLVRVHCTKYCILTLISIDIQYSLKITKCQELVKFNSLWTCNIFLSISIYIYIYLYLSISIYTYIYTYIYNYIYHIYLYISIYLYICISISLYLSIYLSTSLSLYLSLYLSISLSNLI